MSTQLAVVIVVGIVCLTVIICNMEKPDADAVRSIDMALARTNATLRRIADNLEKIAGTQ
jgi:hypothetical protein